MTYDFDTLRPRSGMGSSKWEGAAALGCPPDVVPLTVADMEFATAPEIIDAVRRTTDFGMWGYTTETAALRDAVASWQQSRNGWTPRHEWMVFTPGIVPAIYQAVHAYTQPGDGILVQPPVYGPFFMAAEKNGRKIIENPLKHENGRYEIDFADLAQKAKQAKMMLQCSPHNPVGRVWSAEDLQRVADICAENNVLLFADEIHGDIILGDVPFTSVGALAGGLPANAIVATSLGKTFSLAGAPLSTLFIPDEGLRGRLEDAMDCQAMATNTTFGTAAALAGYTQGGPWLAALLDYLRGNAAFVRDFLAQNLPEIAMAPLQGSYLAWLDFSPWGLPKDKLHALLRQKAAFYANEGEWFGRGGAGFVRVNIACPRAVLQGAFQRLAVAAKGRP